jgi:hypothetical protein
MASTKCATLAFFLALTACATKPLPRVETVRVNVPVPVACLRPDQVPARPVKPDLPTDMQAALAVAVAWAADWVVYGQEADGKLRACASAAGPQ